MFLFKVLFLITIFHLCNLGSDEYDHGLLSYFKIFVTVLDYVCILFYAKTCKSIFCLTSSFNFANDKIKKAMNCDVITNNKI